MATATRLKLKNRRWMASIWYRTNYGLNEVVHYIDELEDLQMIVELGPSFEAIEKIDIRYLLAEGPKTVEQCEAE